MSSIERNKETGGQFLVGYKGWLHSINSDYHVGNMRDGFDCIGSGAVIALGAMKALENFPPTERIRKSLRIAEYFASDVIGPFYIRSIGSKKAKDASGA